MKPTAARALGISQPRGESCTVQRNLRWRILHAAMSGG